MTKYFPCLKTIDLLIARILKYKQSFMNKDLYFISIYNKAKNKSQNSD